MRTALILGASGQTGSYLSEHLLKQGHHVLGGIRRTSSKNLWRLQNSLSNERFKTVKCDVTDLGNVISTIQTYRPDWIFNLAAQSHVGTSFEQAKHTMDVVYGGCLNVLEAIRILNITPRVYQASSSEMFGSSYSVKYPEHRIVGTAYHDHPDGKYKKGDTVYQLEDGRFTTENNTEDWANYRYQDEETPFSPCSPYGVAKLAAHQLCNVYRNAYGMDIRCGIMNNHCSPRRSTEFVTKKVTSYIGDLLAHAHKQSTHIAPLYNTTGQVKRVPVYDFPLLTLGNCNTCRDWGHASEYAEVMIRIMEMEEPLDLVVGTGQTHSVLEFVKYAFQYAGIDYTKHIEFNTRDNLRPYEVDYLRADASLAQKMLGWKPRVSFHQLIQEMVDYELTERNISRNV